MLRFLSNLYRSKWGLLRLAVACFITYAIAADAPARFARLQLAALPGFDYAAEVRALRVQRRYGEAVMVAQAGLQDPQAANPTLENELKATTSERDSLLRRVKDAGMGALSGRGDSLESLVGVIAADFFIVGDVRDLVIEGGKQMLDGDSDELVLLLSVVGIATTLAPEIDWAPSILKAARRAGHLTESFADALKRSIKARKGEEVAAVCADVASISKRASPGAAMRILHLAENPQDLARLARFVEKNPAGSFALHVTQKEGALVLRSADDAAEHLVIAASRKGRAGREFLSTTSARVLLRPHPLVGLAKTVWKGNAEKLIARAVDRIDPNAWWALPFAASWAVFEAALVIRRFRAPRPIPKAVPA